MSGPRLLADVGVRGRLGTPWTATGYIGLGLHAHHRDTIAIPKTDTVQGWGEMPYRGALTLGMGIEHRVGNILLGLDFQIRQGVPDDYHSWAVLLSLSRFLNEDEP